MKLILTGLILAIIVVAVKSYPAIPHKSFPPPIRTTSTPALNQIQPISLDYQHFLSSISATAVYVYDPNRQLPIMSKNEHERLLPASTTKIMTAWVALHAFSLNQTVIIEPNNTIIGTIVRLKPFTQITFLDLIKAMLISSGNDAAYALASAYPGGYFQFINQMNQEALNQGLTNTHFNNASGLDNINHYTSAFDLAMIANRAIKNDLFKTIVATQRETVYGLDLKHKYPLSNTNELLAQVSGVVGIKTGYTKAAGECLVTYVDRDTDLIIVILKSSDRFNDTKKIIDWIYSSPSFIDFTHRTNINH